MHNAHRPFQCQQCEAAFYDPKVLRNHTARVHTSLGQKKLKQKENQLAEALSRNAISFQREKRIEFAHLGGTYARIDFFIETSNGTVICLENDESAHKDRFVSCELKRMLDVASAFKMIDASKSVHWIRFNCDAFSIDGLRYKMSLLDRYAALCKHIANVQQHGSSDFSVTYMFYDCGYTNNQLVLDLFDDLNFDENFKKFVRVIGP